MPIGLVDQRKTDGYQAFANSLPHAHDVFIGTQRDHPYIDIIANQEDTFSTQYRPASRMRAAS